MIETTPNGVYTTTRYGVPIAKEPIFFTVPELDMLRQLANELDTPVGNLLVRLGHAERVRLSQEAIDAT